MKYRLLLTKHNSGAMNMAIDEAVLTHVSENKVLPTIRFYGWEPSCISIGYFQDMKEEVDLDKCKVLGVESVRRITGGGAVYHDKEVTYSIITPINTFSKDILQSYKEICEGVIAGVKKLGIDANFAPLNDIITNGKKISGNAQTRRMNCILQHGTILYDVDIKKMFSLLLIPNEKIRDKMIQVVEERVTSINKESGKDYSYKEVEDALVEGFKEALGIELELGELTDSEKELAEKLAAEKYSTDEWRLKK